MNLSDRILYLESVNNLFSEIRPNLFLTFNFNPPRKRNPKSNADLESNWSTSPEVAHKKLRRFFNEMQLMVFDASWRRQSLRRWPTAVGVCEHVGTNIHFHILANACERISGAIELFGSETWSAIIPGGTFSFRKIYDEAGAISYIGKEQLKIGMIEWLFFYSDPRPPIEPSDELIPLLLVHLKRQK